jgi:hypothetical protein
MVYTLIVVQVRCVYACAPGHRPVVGSGLRSGVFTFNYIYRSRLDLNWFQNHKVREPKKMDMCGRSLTYTGLNYRTPSIECGWLTW